MAGSRRLKHTQASFFSIDANECMGLIECSFILKAYNKEINILIDKLDISIPIHFLVICFYQSNSCTISLPAFPGDSFLDLEL